MVLPAKAQPEYSAAFRELLRKADVSLVHLAPRNTASLGVSVAADTADILRGLARAYEVMPRDIIRAAIVIGLEELTGCAEELGHNAPQKAPD